MLSIDIKGFHSCKMTLLKIFVSVKEMLNDIRGQNKFMIANWPSRSNRDDFFFVLYPIFGQKSFFSGKRMKCRNKPLMTKTLPIRNSTNKLEPTFLSPEKFQPSALSVQKNLSYYPKKKNKTWCKFNIFELW